MDARITELEIKISYAEDMIDELNRVVFRQQQQIDLLVGEVKGTWLGARKNVSTMSLR